MPPRTSAFAAIATPLALVALFLWSFVTGIENPLHSAAAAATPEEVAPMLPREVTRGIRIEVLNGSGVPGIARAATRRLRDRGFDVVYIGNAESFDYENTQILLRAGERAYAEAVAHALFANQVLDAPNPDLALEVTVILGKDFDLSGHP